MHGFGPPDTYSHPGVQALKLKRKKLAKLVHQRSGHGYSVSAHLAKLLPHKDAAQWNSWLAAHKISRDGCRAVPGLAKALDDLRDAAEAALKKLEQKQKQRRQKQKKQRQ